MKRIAKVLGLAAVISFMVTFPAGTATAESTSIKDTNLTGYTVILHTNDSHGRAVADSYNGYMGFTAVSALKKEYEAAGAQVIVLDAGDTLHGLPYATLDQGANIIELMNLVGYDAMVPGNHDFNYGTDILKRQSNTMDFPLLSANIAFKESGEKLLEKHVLVEKNGIKYGIFGLSTPETAYKTNPKNVDSIEFADPVKAAKEEVEELEEEGAGCIIALSHLGTTESTEGTSLEVAKAVKGIDVIVDGHSHTTLKEGKKVNDTLIVSAGEYLENIGVVVIDKDGNKKASLVDAKEYGATDAAIDVVVKKHLEKQDNILQEVVGYTMVPLEGARENVRSKETNLGNLTTDAMRSATKADAALTNGGGIRSSIGVGNITRKDLVSAFPFGNYVVTVKVKGKTLLEVLEKGVSQSPAPSGGFLQVSGITFSFDMLKPAGSRVIKAEINQKELDSKATYLLAINDFMKAGGDSYKMLADIPVENEYDSIEEILTRYIKGQGNIGLETEGRITSISGNNQKESTLEEDSISFIEEDKSVEDIATKDSILNAINDKNIDKKAIDKKATDSKATDKKAIDKKDPDKKETDKNNTMKKDTKKEGIDKTDTEKNSGNKTEDNSKKKELEKSAQKSKTDVKKGQEKKETNKKTSVYVVVKGDCLIKIALKLYDEEMQWKNIYEWNKEDIKNPEKLHIGQKLKIYK